MISKVFSISDMLELCGWNLEFLLNSVGCDGLFEAVPLASFSLLVAAQRVNSCRPGFPQGLCAGGSAGHLPTSSGGPHGQLSGAWLGGGCVGWKCSWTRHAWGALESRAVQRRGLCEEVSKGLTLPRL